MARKVSQFYKNKNVQYLIRQNIVEWDIQRAGLQALKTLGVISDDTYKYWKFSDKSKNVKYIGKTIPESMEKSNEMISSAVNAFIEKNKIPEDHIISKDRDALTIFNHNPTITQISGFQFVKKRLYTSFVRVNDFDIYYGKGELMIKGIDKRYTTDHMLIPYIKDILQSFEGLAMGYYSYDYVYRTVHKIRNQYCNLELPLGCYREIAYENPLAFNDKTSGQIVYFSKPPEVEPDRYELVTSYNFMLFIVPFINILPSLKGRESWKTKTNKKEAWE